MGGSKALGNFSENSSDLVAGPFPQKNILLRTIAKTRSALATFNFSFIVESVTESHSQKYHMEAQGLPHKIKGNQQGNENVHKNKSFCSHEYFQIFLISE